MVSKKPPFSIRASRGNDDKGENEESSLVGKSFDPPILCSKISCHLLYCCADRFCDATSFVIRTTHG